MYFPYLRGRQFELIALRDLLDKNLISDRIFPIIEPVKLSSSLTKTLDLYKQKNRALGVIMNPCVGDLSFRGLTDLKNPICKAMHDIMQKSSIQKAFHLDASIQKQVSDLEEIILVAMDKEKVDLYNQLYGDGKEPKYTLMPDESDFRRNIRNHHRICLADNFNKQDKNADYKNNYDELYTRDHLYYEDDGYVGFSDFSIVGNEYSESGFAPYAVAIHIVYLEKETMRIAHFVSDSNEDYSDTTGKFKEALKKLVAWNKDHHLETYAMQEFQRLYKEEIYPGLGTIKKLSIMHHIELVDKYLNSK